jgi:hypothetical protein
MRHHFSLIQSYLADGETQKAEQYLAQAQADIDAITPVRYCENHTVNLILSSFAGKAKQLDVALFVNAVLPSQLSIPETELCAVLSNALENAVMVASLVEDASLRKVYLNCKVSNKLLLLYMQNSYIGTVVMEHGLPKACSLGHGLGSKSMATIAEKRNGYCNCEASDGTFTLRIALPLDA